MLFEGKRKHNNKEKEYTITDGYFFRMRRKRDILYVSIYNTNNYIPIAVLPITMQNKKYFYFENEADAQEFILRILSAIAETCSHEEEGRDE